MQFNFYVSTMNMESPSWILFFGRWNGLWYSRNRCFCLILRQPKLDITRAGNFDSNFLELAHTFPALYSMSVLVRFQNRQCLCQSWRCLCQIVTSWHNPHLKKILCPHRIIYLDLYLWEGWKTRNLKAVDGVIYIINDNSIEYLIEANIYIWPIWSEDKNIHLNQYDSPMKPHIDKYIHATNVVDKP